MKKLLALALLLPFIVGADDLSCRGSTDERQRRDTERLVGEANARIGMPGIVNFTERRFAKMILELRDSEIATYTYTVDLQGRAHFLCQSIGYGLPYSVQFTNPERYYQNGATVPQPDPNGLFMPSGLAATWVLCSDNGKIKPVYSEPNLLVSPFPLKATSSYRQAPAAGD